MADLKQKSPTEAENEVLGKLFVAIYFNDIEKVVEFRDQFPEIYAKKEHFLVEHRTPFDLRYLTFLNQIVWFDECWRDEIRPFVHRNRAKTAQMLDYWYAESGIEKLPEDFQYNHYFEYFCCENPNAPESYNKIILTPISELLGKGIRDLDLRLYTHVSCFNFESVKVLLALGANPNINMDEEDSMSSAMGHVEAEDSFLATCEIIPEFQLFEKNGYHQRFYIPQMFGNLLGFAAYEEMYNLLKPYQEL